MQFLGERFFIGIFLTIGGITSLFQTRAKKKPQKALLAIAFLFKTLSLSSLRCVSIRDSSS